MSQAFCYVVICREDRKPDGSLGDYSLATRRSFRNKRGAESYARTLSESRNPIVVSGRFYDLADEEVIASLPGCVRCGHTCVAEGPCDECGSDTMILGDALCVHCDAIDPNFMSQIAIE